MGRINLNRKTAPAKEPVTVDTLRAHLRKDDTDEDTYLGDIIIPSARRSVEHALGQGLVTQTWEWYWDGGWPGVGVLEFPIGPVLSVNSIKYLDADGVETTWATSNYTVAIKGPIQRLWLNESIVWPTVKRQTPEVAWVDFDVGYGANPDDVPAELRHLVLLMAEHIYEHRGPVLTGTVVHKVPHTLDYLVDQHRTLDFAPTATTSW